MYQLNYHSKARPGLNLEDLDQILEKANEINASRDITGCLIYHKQNFVQILEGQINDVLEVYEKIKVDDRHNNVTLLWEGKVDKRHFTGWNMAYYKPNNLNIKEYVNNLLLLSTFSAQPKGSLLSFWQSVKRILQEVKPSTLETN